MEPIRVAIIGCGNMAGAHARRLKVRDDVEIVALCDPRDEAMERLLERRLAEVEPAPKRFSDTAEMYQQARPDAVVIVTPHTLHHDQAVDAMQRGCHVLLEKPMVTDVADARDLVRQVEQSGKTLVVCYNTAFTGPFIYLRQAIRDGLHGRLELVTGYLSQNWKVLTAGSWRQDPQLSGGGQAYDSGAHLLNSLCWTLEQPVEEVSAMLDRQGTAVDINTVLIARMGGGVMASIAIGGDSAPDGSHLAFVFDRARVEIDGWKGEWIRVIDESGEVTEVDTREHETDPDANFIDAIQGQAEPLVTAQHGLVQSQLMQALYASAESGQAVRPE